MRSVEISSSIHQLVDIDKNVHPKHQQFGRVFLRLAHMVKASYIHLRVHMRPSHRACPTNHALVFVCFHEPTLYFLNLCPYTALFASTLKIKHPVQHQGLSSDICPILDPAIRLLEYNIGFNIENAPAKPSDFEGWLSESETRRAERRVLNTWYVSHIMPFQVKSAWCQQA